MSELFKALQELKEGKSEQDELLQEMARSLAYWHQVCLGETHQDTPERWDIRAKEILAKVKQHYGDIEETYMKGWRKGNELKKKRLDIKLKMAREEAKKQGFDEGVRKTTDAMDSTFASLLKEAKKQEKERERERILDLLQGLLEMSEKNKEPSIKVRMMSVLQALKEGG